MVDSEVFVIIVEVLDLGLYVGQRDVVTFQQALRARHL